MPKKAEVTETMKGGAGSNDANLERTPLHSWNGNRRATKDWSDKNWRRWLIIRERSHFDGLSGTFYN